MLRKFQKQHFHILIKESQIMVSESQQSFAKSLTIWTITSVDIFDISCLFVRYLELSSNCMLN